MSAKEDMGTELDAMCDRLLTLAAKREDEAAALRRAAAILRPGALAGAETASSARNSAMADANLHAMALSAVRADGESGGDAGANEKEVEGAHAPDPEVPSDGTSDGTILAAVREALASVGSEPFAVGDVTVRVRAGVLVSGPKGKIQVSGVLNRLTKSGHIVLVSKGAGSRPNMYRMALAPASTHETSKGGQPMVTQ